MSDPSTEDVHSQTQHSAMSTTDSTTLATTATTDNSTQICSLLTQCRNATTQEEQLDALRKVHTQLDSTKLTLLSKQHIIRQLFETVVVQGMNNQINIISNQILDSCGMIACVSTSVLCLRIVSNNQKEQRKLHPIIATNLLRNSLSTIHKYMCTITKHPINNRHDEQETSHESLRGWMLEFNGTADDNDSGDDDITSELDLLIETSLLTLPRIISNACLAGKMALPSWSVSTRIFPRMVHSGLERLQQLRCIDTALSPDTYFPVIRYMERLILHLVQTHRCDDLVVGIMEFGESITISISDGNQQERLSSENVTELVSGALDQPSCSLSPREVAMLVRAFLRYSISRPNHQNMLIYNSISANLLGPSRDRQNAFLQLMAFHSSSLPVDDSQGHKICRATIDLLASAHTISATADKVDTSGVRGNFKDDTIEEQYSDDSDSSSCESYDMVDSNTAKNKRVTSAEIVLRKHTITLLRAWSTQVFIQGTDLQIQRHVTRMILYAMLKLKSFSDNERQESKMIELILKGTTVRLESAITDSRKDGMRVAICLSKRLGHDIQFDEISESTDAELLVINRIEQNSADNESAQNSHDAETSTVEEQPADTKNDEKKPRSQSKKKKQPTLGLSMLMDPDAIVDSADESSDIGDDDADLDDSDDTDHVDDDSIWSDDSGLVPYNIEDDEEDLMETPKPVYLSDCLQYLRATEKEETAMSQHHTALKELPKLVRSQPLDLADIATSLAMQVLRMENMYDLENFPDLVHDGLLALVSQAPGIVGTRLIDELFADNMALGDRMHILSALQGGAAELNLGTPRQNETESISAEKTVSSHMTSLSLTSTNISSHQIAKLESQTRRKRSRKLAPPMTRANQFGQVASTWFYSIVSLFMKHKSEETLWMGSVGSRFMAHLFVTLARIVEASGNTPGTNVMAWDLLQLVWSFRNVEVPDIRMAVLMACGTSLVLLPEDKLYQILSGGVENGSFAKQLLDMSAADPDPSCRRMAGAISNSFVEMINNVGLQNSIILE